MDTHKNNLQHINNI